MKILRTQEWDEDLAAIASNYAQECTFNYNPHRHDLSSSFSYVGENIAAILTSAGDNAILDPWPGRTVYEVTGDGVASNRINITEFVASVRRWYTDDAPFYLYRYHHCNPLARCQCRFYLQVYYRGNIKNLCDFLDTSGLAFYHDNWTPIIIWSFFLFVPRLSTPFPKPIHKKSWDDII